jgi:hypothetical protein
VTGEGSVLSRFTVKFLEVFAAGLATAVSGYLLAHFTGILAAPNPTSAVQPPLAIERGIQNGTQGAVQGAVQVKPPAPAPAASAPAVPVVNAAPAAAPPQSSAANQPAAANVREAKPRDAAETRPRDPVRGAAAESFEARMRAALAKAGPANPASSDAPHAEGVAPVDAVPRSNVVAPPLADTPTGSIASAPPPAGRAPPNTASVPPPAAPAPPMPPAPMPQAPTMQNPAAQTATVQLASPAAVEIKSQPIASVDANQPAEGATAPSTDQEGLFSGITKRLRSNAPLPDDQAPRPPMPVGQ